MKKQVIVSMIAVATAMAMVSPAQAVTTARAGVKEALVDYVGKVKESAFGKSRSAQGLDAQAAKKIQDKFVSKLGLDSMSNQLSLALADGAKSSQRLEALAAVYAVKAMSIEVSKRDAAEGKSMSDSAEVFAKLIANSALIGGKAAKELTAEQAKEVGEALSKAEVLTETVITKFDRVERDAWTSIFKRTAELVEQGKSIEDAAVLSIMEVKKATKEEALEMLRKLKECV